MRVAVSGGPTKQGNVEAVQYRAGGGGGPTWRRGGRQVRSRKKYTEGKQPRKRGQRIVTASGVSREASTISSYDECHERARTAMRLQPTGGFDRAQRQPRKVAGK